jgi:hypothetical protein
MRTASLNRVPLRLLIALALLGVRVENLFAQETNAPAAETVATPSFGRVKDFYVPDYYESPNQNQMKSLLRGDEAEPQPNGRVLIRELRVETYRLDGTTDLTVRAPECLYDASAQVASSAGRFEARSGDGKLFVEGEGFRWQQADSTFTISNRVHTIVQQTSLTVPKP